MPSDLEGYTNLIDFYQSEPAMPGGGGFTYAYPNHYS